jgi:rubrerythrin
MSLATFGAILSYALGLESAAFDFYSKATEHIQESIFESLAAKAKKSISRLERLRREGITEMILEPIYGLEESDFPILSGIPEDRQGLLSRAYKHEETRRRFYEKTAQKLPIRDVARQFARMAMECAESLEHFKQI